MSAFTVGQRVTVVSEMGRPLAITTVRLISHNGTRVHLAGRDGYSDEARDRKRAAISTASPVQP